MGRAAVSLPGDSPGSCLYLAAALLRCLYHAIPLFLPHCCAFAGTGFSFCCLLPCLHSLPCYPTSLPAVRTFGAGRATTILRNACSMPLHSTFRCPGCMQNYTHLKVAQRTGRHFHFPLAFFFSPPCCWHDLFCCSFFSGGRNGAMRAVHGLLACFGQTARFLWLYVYLWGVSVSCLADVAFWRGVLAAIAFLHEACTV